ncbi:pre-tRNA nuclear export protein [Dimargaris xerosporica]|nr:pre-tRNA nuclear export protein [Dimargaris xerosporica]
MDLIMFKFKPTIISTLNELVMPLAEKVFAFLDPKPLGTDDAIQQVDLKKGYLNFLATIIYTDMSSVLLTDTNKPRLMGLLQSLLPLATTPDQPEVQKMAFNLLGRLAQAWLGQCQPNANSSPDNAKPSSKPGQPVPIARHPVVAMAPSDQEALLQFYYERVVPLCFEVAMKPTFTLSDSANVLVFYEMAYVLQVLQVRADPQFSEYVATRVLPSMQCPPNMCTEFVQAMQSLDIKEFRKYFQRFLGK